MNNLNHRVPRRRQHRYDKQVLAYGKHNGHGFSGGPLWLMTTPPIGNAKQAIARAIEEQGIRSMGIWGLRSGIHAMICINLINGEGNDDRNFDLLVAHEGIRLFLRSDGLGGVVWRLRRWLKRRGYNVAISCG